MFWTKYIFLYLTYTPTGYTNTVKGINTYIFIKIIAKITLIYLIICNYLVNRVHIWYNWWLRVLLFNNMLLRFTFIIAHAIFKPSDKLADYNNFSFFRAKYKFNSKAYSEHLSNQSRMLYVLILNIFGIWLEKITLVMSSW